jgi:hypothetical protein
LRFLLDFEGRFSMKNLRSAMLLVPLAIGLAIGYVWGQSAKEHSQAMAAEGAKSPPACCKAPDLGNKQGCGCCAKKARDGSTVEAKAAASCCKTVSTTEKPQGDSCCAKKAEDDSAAEAKAPKSCCKMVSTTEKPQGDSCCVKKIAASAQENPSAEAKVPSCCKTPDLGIKPTDDNDSSAYSVSVRIKRTTSEYAYIQVPVTDEVMETDEAGTVVADGRGSAHIDPKKLIQLAIKMAGLPSVKWYREEQHTEPHPIQKAPEESERSSRPGK